MKRGDKLYEDRDFVVDLYLDCRDGIVKCVEYNDMSGYGSKIKLYLCENIKYEVISLIREVNGIEEVMDFDLDFFKFFLVLFNNKIDELGSKFIILRDYSIN